MGGRGNNEWDEVIYSYTYLATELWWAGEQDFAGDGCMIGLEAGITLIGALFRVMDCYGFEIAKGVHLRMLTYFFSGAFTNGKLRGRGDFCLDS